MPRIAGKFSQERSLISLFCKFCPLFIKAAEPQKPHTKTNTHRTHLLFWEFFSPKIHNPALYYHQNVNNFPACQKALVFF